MKGSSLFVLSVLGWAAIYGFCLFKKKNQNETNGSIDSIMQVSSMFQVLRDEALKLTLRKRRTETQTSSNLDNWKILNSGCSSQQHVNDIILSEVNDFQFTPVQFA